MDKATIEEKVCDWSSWWLGERAKKVREKTNETLTVNPFMVPLLFKLHGLSSIEELSDLIVASHLMGGHATGFGKLVDEKILPDVFGAKKLDAGYRRSTKFSDSCFDEIDHVISRQDGTQELLSLKSSRWTIQLSMAVQLNDSFHKILSRYKDINHINVGVFFGSSTDMTDKYRIIRGINSGANHSVFDIRSNVSVKVGKHFWSWLNNDEEETQDWVLNGILRAIKRSNLGDQARNELKAYGKSVAEKYELGESEDIAKIDWQKLLRLINP